MTGPDMTLSGFLLARAADRERDAARWHDADCATSLHGGWNVRPELCDCGVPARVRAEAEALRNIVEARRPFPDGCSGHPGPWLPHGDYGPGYCRRGDEDDWTLRWLAAPHADHPDYRQEWKP